CWPTLSRWFSTSGRSAATPAAVATLSANSPSAWPTGSSLWRPTPVDPTAVDDAFARCELPLLGVVRTPLPPYSRWPEKPTPRVGLSTLLSLLKSTQLALPTPFVRNLHRISAMPAERSPAYGIAGTRRSDSLNREAPPTPGR